MLASALQRWDEVADRLRGASFAVFLDYDGTLAAIAPRPELATLPEAQRDRVRRIAAAHRVAIVTGRGMADVRRLVGLPALHYAADHGLQISGPSLAFEADPKLRPTFEGIAAELADRVANIPGLVLEPKAYSVAVHFRLAAEDSVPALEATVDEIVARSSSLRKGVGKKVFEIRPTVHWHKGAAVAWLLEQWGATLPVYLGDDRTDEDAFETVREHDGIGIIVGEPAWPTAATLTLSNPEAVGLFLDRLATV